MKIVIQTLDFVLPAELDAFITQQVMQLVRHSVPVIRAEVILGEDAQAAAKARFCNIRLITAGNAYLVSQHENSYDHAVEAAVEELHRKLQGDITNSLA